MNKSTIATSLLIAGGLTGLIPSIATSETQSGLNIPDNDSVYVDGKTFQVIPGKAKGDTAAQIKSLAARDLGPGAVIIRSGDKLYIADAQTQAAAGYDIATAYAYDPRSMNPRLQGGGSAGYNQNAATDYAYDPHSINPALTGGGSWGYNQHMATDYRLARSNNLRLQGGGSAGYNQNAATDYAYDPRSINPRLQGGGNPGYNQNVATDYAYDPNRVAAAQPSIIYDPDYVEYRLKQAFENNWTPISPK